MSRRPTDRRAKGLFSFPWFSRDKAHNTRPASDTRPARDARLFRAVDTALEPLEHRMLMAVDTPLQPNQFGAIKSGLAGLSNWADTLDNFGDFAKQLPVVGRSIGQSLNLGDTLRTSLVDPLNNLAGPTPTQLAAAIQNHLPGTTVTANDDPARPHEILFNVTLNKTRSENRPLDFGANAESVSADASFTAALNTTLGGSFTFGFDTTGGLSPSEAFFLRFAPGTGFVANASVGINPANFGIGLGSLGPDASGNAGARVVNGNLALSGGVSAALVDQDVDGKVTLDELDSTSLDSMVTVTRVHNGNDLSATLPVQAKLGTFTGSGTVTVTDADLFDATAPAVALSSTDLTNFKDLTPGGFVALLRNVGTSLQAVASGLNPDGGIPFVGEAMSQAVNFGDLFNELTRPLFDTRLTGAASYTSQNEALATVTEQARFTLTVTAGANSFSHNVTAGTGAQSDVVNSINNALVGTSLSGLVTATVEGTRVKLAATTADHTLTVQFHADDKGMEQLGFEDSLSNAAFRFSSIQSAIPLLAQKMGVVPAALNLDYDGASKALLFSIKYTDTFDREVELNFTDTVDLGLGKLAVTGELEAAVTGTATADIRMGVNVGNLADFDPANPNPDQDPLSQITGNDFFVQTGGKVTANASFQGGGDLTAALGMLELGVHNATANFNVTGQLTLGEPAPGDTKIEPGEFIKPGVLSAPTFTAGGNVVLPLGLAGADTVGVTVPNDAAVTLNFESGPPISVDADVQGLDDLIDQFADFSTDNVLGVLKQLVDLIQNSSLPLFNEPLPLVGKSLRELLSFGQSLADGLSTATGNLTNLRKNLLGDAPNAGLVGALKNAIGNTPLLNTLNATGAAGEEVAHHIAHAVEAVEDAAKALAEVVDDAATFKLPSNIVSAVSTLTHALHHAGEYAESLPAGQPRQEIEAGLAQLQSGLDAITKVLPAVQRLASYLFDALSLGQLVNFSALETAVRPALQQTLDGLTDNATNAAARADIAEVIELLDGALGTGSTFAALGGPAALAGPGDLDSFKLLQGLDGLRKLVQKYGTPEGVLADDPAVNNEPGDFIRQALASYLASLPGKPNVQIVGDDLNIGFDFSIARGPFFQSLDFDLSDIVGNGVAQYLPLDIKSGGEVELSVGAELKLDFGVDLANITSDPLSALFFRDSTELTLNALIQSTNFTASASIGSVDAITLGPAGHPGTLTLRNDANDGPAKFGLGLIDTPNHKIPFSQFGLDDFGLVEDGSLNLSVPILVDDAFVTTDGSNDPAKIDPLSLTMTDLRDFKTLDFNIPDRLAETLEKELLSLDFLIKGLRAYIDKLTGGMLSDIIRKFPFIGNTLDLLTSSLAKLLAPPTTPPAGGSSALAAPGAAAAGATPQVAPGEGFLDQVETRINQLIEGGKADASKLLEKFVEDALRQLFFDLLGPKSSGGLGVLKLRADTSAPGDTTIDFNDVMIDVQGDLSSLSDTKIIAYLPLEGTNELAHADFDLGFDGLGLVGFHTQGNVELNLSWSVDLAFEISKTGGFTVLLDSNPFNANDTDEVSVGVVANLSPGATLNANLFFLALEATDRNGQSNLHANAVLDIEKAGDRLPINDFSGIKFKPALSGGMLIDLALRTGISTGAITPNSNLPSMQADLLVDWGFNINPDTGFSAESPVVELNNIGLDLGEFVSKALGPVIDMLDDYLAPIKPLLDFLNQEIPVISQVAQLVGLDPVRFIDAIGALGSGAATVQRLVDVLTAITDLLADIQAIADAGSVVIPLGDIKFGKGDQLDRKKNTFSAANIGDRFTERFADAYKNIGDAGQAAKSFIDGLTGNTQGATALAPQANAAFGSIETALGKFSIPLFESPIKIVDLLFGKDVDLVTWDIPRLEAKFEFSQLFGPIIPPFPVFAKIGGGFGIFCDLYMGMDTRGIRTGDFFKGVYFGDTLGAQDGAKEVAELGVTMEFKAGAELSIPFAKAGVEGGIQAEITADWNDPDDNGKVHFDELAENFSHGLQCVFDLAGKLDAFIGAYLNIEIPLGITSITIIDVSFDIFRATIFDFSYTCPPLPAPVPGTNDNGTLRLNIGDRAGQRQPGATDGDETIKVFGEMDRNGDGTITLTTDINGDGKITEEEMGDDLDGDGVIEDGVLALSGFGVFQIVGGGSGPAITSIVANAGAGKDSITLDKSVRVSATLSGGAGDDTIVGGSAGDTLSGGEGADTITGNGGNDTITGGAGNDKLAGNAGADTVRGEDGDDQLFGGSNDGDEGTKTPGTSADDDLGDTVEGGAGNDQIYGHLGGDNLTGGAGADTIAGGDGNDTIDGGADNDLIFGDAGDDTATGGSGDDQMKGGDGTDNFDGQGNNDYVEGGKGNDTVKGGTGNDNLIGGSTDAAAGNDDGSDTIEGGDGNDVILGDNGTIGDTISLVGGAGNDVINAGIGNDTVYGQAGNDTVDAGADADTVIAGEGDDTVRGGTGTDTILGNAGADHLFGDADADTIEAGLGDDRVFGGTGYDLLKGQEGHDYMEGNAGADTILGGTGNDSIIGGSSAQADINAGTDEGDSIVGAAGDDVILGDNGTISGGEAHTIEAGGSGADTIYGSAGSDIIFGGGDDDLLVGDSAIDSGNDIVVGDEGDKTATQVVARTSESAGNDIISGSAGIDILLGGQGSDLISGDAGDDVALGDNGVVTLSGGVVVSTRTSDPSLGGFDTITGAAGNDILLGGAAGDSIDGGEGDDVALGDNGKVTGTAATTIQRVETTDPAQGGNDTMTGGLGSDVMLGGAGSDTMTGDLTANDDLPAGVTADDVLLGDNGFLQLVPAQGQVRVITTSDPNDGASDTIVAGDGDDVVMGGTASETISAGEGNDLVFGDHGKLELDGPPNDNFFSIDTLASQGGAADTIQGDAGDDIVIGGQGGDQVFGGDNDDDLIGGHNVPGGADGADTIDGGSGNDAIAGDNAHMVRRTDSASPRFRALAGLTMYKLGPDGFFTATYEPNVTAASQQSPAGVVGRDVFLYDHAFDTTAEKFGGDNIAGGAGHDSIWGQLGDDTIQGDASVAPLANGQSVDNPATDGDDYVEGNGGNDLIYGNQGQDDLIGGSSRLYGLNTAAQRPDGADVIFGGSGTRTARNDAGDTSATGGHANDADMIIGDNGTVFRLVVVGGNNATSYVTFNYDNYGGKRLIPRAVELHDYTADDNASNDTGGADRIHGEAGDDTVHGMGFNDVIYGDGQDDDLLGESGDDWMSGGTGTDGMLGDDGKLFTSRNGLTEPLYNINTAAAQETATTPGNLYTAVINVAGQLNKSADLEPFDIDGAVFGKDVMYGGLGDDRMHGGMNNDAMSGAEALETFYNNPNGVAGPQFNPATGKFDLPGDPQAFDYSTAGSLRRIEGHVLNFSEAEIDGADALFGDNGNDWLVGGRGSDHLFGGRGNDILNADDNLATNNGANDVPDQGPFAEGDIAFGGGGRDTLLGNTGADRLIDWVGEFNNYVVPFAPFGDSTVTRQILPGLVDWLLKVSKADGADQTRVGPGLGTAARNGEPFGELGLVLQQDSEWQSQTGGPAEDQAGNKPGGRK